MTSLLQIGDGVAGSDTLNEAGSYLYMADLRKLDACRPAGDTPVPAELRAISTPLRGVVWEEELRAHPDREFVHFLVRGLLHGFRIGFQHGTHSCVSARRNMISALQHTEPIEAYLSKEVGAGRMIGPLPKGFAGVHVSRFGVIPKLHQPGKWRLITDLSSPKGASVNDGIDPLLCSLSYVSVDDAVRRIISLGSGALLAKLDVESAYCLVLIHPCDCLLLGVEWKGQLYVDGALPFGLRSAPKLFLVLADALLWVMGRNGVVYAIHYLDDYLVMAPLGTDECRSTLHTCLRLCERLGVPIADHKVDGPATALTFLGIEIDTEAGALRLPQEKLHRLQGLITSWAGHKSCSKQELLSLIGQLQHACRVIRPGRTFRRRMINLSTVATELHHHIRLSADFRSDLQWWALFLEDWNGGVHLQERCAAAPHRYIDIGRLRLMGLRSIYRRWPVVSDPMAKKMGWCLHHRPRTPPHYRGSCRVGPPVEGADGSLSLRQCGGRGNSEIRHLQAWDRDAPHAVPVFFYGSSPAVPGTRAPGRPP